MNKLISVIIPVYNHAKAIERSLQTLFGQTYKNIEVIIVDDGSTDNLEEVLARLKNKYDFKLIKQENKGAPAARNRGVAEAKGDYLIFWDADTIAVPHMLEKMVRALEDNGNASYAYSQFKFGWKKMKSHVFDSSLLKKVNYIDVTSLIKQEDFPTFGWDESIKKFQDWDLWLTMLKQEKTGVFIPEVLYKKIVGFRKGYSSWLPSLAYRLPWKFKKVNEYDNAKTIIESKHL